MSETQEQTALAVVETLVPAKLYAPGKVEEMLTKIEQEVRSKAETLDISTPKNRKEIISLAAKVASSKVAMDEAGKKLTEEWRVRTKAVNAERNIIVERMDKLRDETRKPVTDWENAEKSRIDAHHSALSAIAEPAGYGQTETSAELTARLVYLRGYPERDWQEFAVPAQRAIAAEIERTQGLLEAVQKRETEQAELARLRAAEEERQRIAAEEARIAREAEIARRAAEAARVKAEQEAAAKAAAIEAERARKDAEAKADHDRLAAQAAKAEQDRLEAIEASKRAAANAERAAKEAAERAEQRRAEDAAKAKAEQEAAIAAERKRAADVQAQRDLIAAAEKAEAEQKANDKAHRAAINNKIVTALSSIVPEAVAKEIIKAIVLGTVPHVRIGY